MLAKAWIMKLYCTVATIRVAADISCITRATYLKTQRISRNNGTTKQYHV